MKPLLMAASLLALVVGTSAQHISSQDVATAIEQGRDGKTLEKKCKANGQNGFDIVVEGPVGRIMRAAREAKKEDRAFTAADVTPTLSASVLTVTARRDATLNNSSAAVPHPSIPGLWVVPEQAQAARVQHTVGEAYRAGITVRSKQPGPNGPIILPAISTVFTGEMLPRSRSSRTPLENSDMRASFDLAAFRALPQGDVEVVAFMTDAGERTCKISDKDRSAIR